MLCFDPRCPSLDRSLGSDRIGRFELLILLGPLLSSRTAARGDAGAVRLLRFARFVAACACLQFLHLDTQTSQRLRPLVSLSSGMWSVPPSVARIRRLVLHARDEDATRVGVARVRMEPLEVWFGALLRFASTSSSAEKLPFYVVTWKGGFI